MLCPYCRNKIDDNSEKCEICGVDLTYQQEKRKQTGVGSIILFVVGIIFIFTGFFFTITVNRGMQFFNNSTNIQSIMSLFGSMPLFIGIILSIVGIVGMIKSKSLEGDGNPNTKNKTRSLVSLIITVVYFVIWYASLGVIFGMNKIPSSSISSFTIISFAVIPMPIFLVFVINFFKGRK